jgi:hypothetical protein
MQALRTFEEVDSKGMVQINIPKEFGGRVEILVFPVNDNGKSQESSVDQYFLNHAFEDDATEDAIWEKYTKEKQA